jgi:hypothetical protein
MFYNTTITIYLYIYNIEVNYLYLYRISILYVYKLMYIHRFQFKEIYPLDINLEFHNHMINYGVYRNLKS